MIWLLDPGHGRDTAGKRSPVWPDGRQLLEWEFTRATCRRLIRLCDAAGMRAIDLVCSDADVPLSVRVLRAEHYREIHGDPCCYLSLHANAGGGTGWECWTSRGQTLADTYAQVFARHARAYYPDMVIRCDRTDGDDDKESDFYVLRKTSMPAVLIEFAFMDRLDPDCEALMGERGRDGFAAMTHNAMREIEETS